MHTFAAEIRSEPSENEHIISKKNEASPKGGDIKQNKSMTKKKLTKAAACHTQEMKDNMMIMVQYGEPMGLSLMRTLASTGSSTGALMAETYAMAKAWAALKAIARNKKMDPQGLFEKLVPMFEDEMEQAVHADEREN